MFTIKSPGVYHHQSGLLSRVGELVAPFSSRIAVLTSPRAWDAVRSTLSESLTKADVQFDVHLLEGECTSDAIAYHRHQIAQEGVHFVLGVGGGRVMDCAKAVADGLDNGQVATLPTIAATCAGWSPISILYDEQGGHQGTQVLQRMPEMVLVDSDVIARSDVRYLKAGIVDALAKWYEFQPYLAKNSDNLALNLKIQAAALAKDTFVQWGEQALHDNAEQRVTRALQKVIDANIALAGLANSMRDDSPSPGVAHAIHNRMTHLPELHDWLHGEKVGYGLRLQSLLARGDGSVDPDLLTHLQRNGAPVRLPVAEARYAELAKTLSETFKFPEASAALLPFSLTPEAIRHAVLATQYSA
ncbi:iron-containing alcohol dehydrogenase family protein [Dickeya dianthicola]|uniref:iron-containing alcohol dehydrogenase family protein n=1 Tax=Dickeya dianthicola TaxID=204039 RepID=UPI0030170524